MVGMKLNNLFTPRGGLHDKSVNSFGNPENVSVGVWQAFSTPEKKSLND
jgi:hypothetical protein